LIAEPTNPDDLLGVIREWFQLLALDRWEDASRMLDEPNSYGIRWTPEYIRYALNEAYQPGCRFWVDHPDGPRFSDPTIAIGTLLADVVPFEDQSGYSAYHDVPLNSSWSDLTAQFEFLRRPGGLAVVLHDLHVM
jgi:hypothetical protein